MLDWQGKTWIKIISAVLIIAFLTYDIAWATDFTPVQKKQYASRSLFKDKKVDQNALKAQNEENLNNIKDALSHKKNNNTKDSIYRKDLTIGLKASYINDIANIYIPDTIGKVVDSYTSPDSKGTIIHIQDLHTNPEASLNLAGILEILIKDYNLNLVCSEGASGEVDTSSVSSFPDPKVREKVAKVFVNSGELTGEEYLSITKYPDLPIWGIEDTDTYFQHIIEFNKIMKFSPDALTFINQVKVALDKLKPEIYSKELLELDAKETEYQESKLDTAKYLEYLLDSASLIRSHDRSKNIAGGHENQDDRSKNISSSNEILFEQGAGDNKILFEQGAGDNKILFERSREPTAGAESRTARYENIIIFKDSLEAEKTIDQQKVTQDSQNLLTSLQSALKDKDNKSEIETLLTKAALYKDKKISPYSFYSYLDELARRHIKEGLDNYPDFTNFVSYLKQINSLDSIKLFSEIEELTYEIKDLISDNDNQKLLTKSIRNIKFLENFFNLKVSNEGLEYYYKDKDSFKESWFKSTIDVLDSASIAGYHDRSNNIGTQTDSRDRSNSNSIGNPAQYSSSGHGSISWGQSREESVIDKNLADLENFYELAHKRDIAMFTNATSEIETRKPKLTALITGGFHTQGITKLLKENNYSYIVISPYSKTTIDEENYRNLLQGKRKPLKELMSELNEKLRAPMGFVNKRFREAYFKELLPLLTPTEVSELTKETLPERVVILMVAKAIQMRIQKNLRLDNIERAFFNKAFRKKLEGPVEIRQNETTGVIYIHYKNSYVSSEIGISSAVNFNAATKVAVIRPQDALAAERQTQGLGASMVDGVSDIARAQRVSPSAGTGKVMSTPFPVMPTLTAPEAIAFNKIEQLFGRKAGLIGDSERPLDLPFSLGALLRNGDGWQAVLVKVIHPEGKSYKYTNPGFLWVDDKHFFLIARRVPATVDMATASAKGSEIVLLEPVNGSFLEFIDYGIMVPHEPEDRGGAEDPRVVLGGIGITFTRARPDGRYYPAFRFFRRKDGQLLLDKKGRPQLENEEYRLTPEFIARAKNGYLYTASDGIILVIRPDDDAKRNVQFYRFPDLGSILRVSQQLMTESEWKRSLVAELPPSKKLSGKRGPFTHIGFNGVIGDLALIHLAYSSGEDSTRPVSLGGRVERKDYVTTGIRLDPFGLPVGEPAILAGPALYLPPGDVPGVTYGTGIVTRGEDWVLLYAGHDDSQITLYLILLPISLASKPGQVIGNVLTKIHMERPISKSVGAVGIEADMSGGSGADAMISERPLFLGTYTRPFGRDRFRIDLPAAWRTLINKRVSLEARDGIIILKESPEGKHLIKANRKISVGEIAVKANIKLGAEVILIGRGDRIEIWPKAKFDAEFKYLEELGAAINITRTSQDSQKAFFGTYSRTIDEGFRVEIPGEFRSCISNGKVILQVINQNLIRIFDQEEWLSLVKKQNLPDTIFASAYYAELDGQGRVLIPEFPRETSLKPGKDVALIGAGGFIEVYLERKLLKPNYAIPSAIKKAASEENISQGSPIIQDGYRLTIPRGIIKSNSLICKTDSLPGSILFLQVNGRGGINVFVKDKWVEAVDKEASGKAVSERALYRRDMFKDVFAAEIDTQGRILIPEQVRNTIGLTEGGSVTFVSFGTYWEIQPHILTESAARTLLTKAAHFSLLSQRNRFTASGEPVTDQFKVNEISYEIPSTGTFNVTSINRIGEPIEAQDNGVGISFNIRGPTGNTENEEVIKYIKQALKGSISRSQSLHEERDLTKDTTIILADKYDYLAGDHLQNNLIILNAAVIRDMIRNKEKPEFILELITSILSEELAHERGADGEKATEEHLAQACANNTISSLGANQIGQYIAFIEQYGQDLEDKEGYLGYLRKRIPARLTGLALNTPSPTYATKEAMYSAMLQTTEYISQEAGGYYYREGDNWVFVVTTIGTAEDIDLRSVSGKKITGVWHTHGGKDTKEQGIPSENDLLLTLARPAEEAVIISRTHGRIIELRKTWSNINKAPLAKAWTMVASELLKLHNNALLRSLIGVFIAFRIGAREPFLHLSLRPMLGLFQDELGSENYSKDTWSDVAGLLGLEVKIASIQDENVVGAVVKVPLKPAVQKAIAEYGIKAAQDYLGNRVWKIADEILRDLAYYVSISGIEVLFTVKSGILAISNSMPDNLYLNRLNIILNRRADIMKIVTTTNLNVDKFNEEIDLLLQSISNEAEQDTLIRWLAIVLLDRLIRIRKKEGINSIGIALLNNSELTDAPKKGIKIASNDLIRLNDGEMLYETLKKQWTARRGNVEGIAFVDLNRVEQLDSETAVVVTPENFLVLPIALYPKSMPWTKSIFAMGNKRYGRIANAIVRISSAIETFSANVRIETAHASWAQVPQEFRALHHNDEEKLIMPGGRVVYYNLIKSPRENKTVQDAKNGSIVTLEGYRFYVHVARNNQRILISEDIIGAKILTDGGELAILSKALSAVGFEKTKDGKPLIITSLSKSHRLFEDCLQNGFIGINQAFLELYAQANDTQKQYLKILLQVGLEHELRHELGAEDEFELSRIDAKKIARLCEEDDIDIEVFVKFLEDAKIIEGEFKETIQKRFGSLAETPQRRTQNFIKSHRDVFIDFAEAEEELPKLLNTNKKFTVALFDGDSIKRRNEAFGKPIVDWMILEMVEAFFEMALLINDKIENVNLKVFRRGGDEFGFIIETNELSDSRIKTILELVRVNLPMRIESKYGIFMVNTEELGDEAVLHLLEEAKQKGIVKEFDKIGDSIVVLYNKDKEDDIDALKQSLKGVYIPDVETNGNRTDWFTLTGSLGAIYINHEIKEAITKRLHKVDVNIIMAGVNYALSMAKEESKTPRKHERNKGNRIHLISKPQELNIENWFHGGGAISNIFKKGFRFMQNGIIGRIFGRSEIPIDKQDNQVPIVYSYRALRDMIELRVHPKGGFLIAVDTLWQQRIFKKIAEQSNKQRIIHKAQSYLKSRFKFGMLNEALPGRMYDADWAIKVFGYVINKVANRIFGKSFKIHLARAPPGESPDKFLIWIEPREETQSITGHLDKATLKRLIGLLTTVRALIRKYTKLDISPQVTVVPIPIQPTEDQKNKIFKIIDKMSTLCIDCGNNMEKAVAEQFRGALLTPGNSVKITKDGNSRVVFYDGSMEQEEAMRRFAEISRAYSLKGLLTSIPLQKEDYHRTLRRLYADVAGMDRKLPGVEEKLIEIIPDDIPFIGTEDIKGAAELIIELIIKGKEASTILDANEVLAARIKEKDRKSPKKLSDIVDPSKVDAISDEFIEYFNKLFSAAEEEIRICILYDSDADGISAAKNTEAFIRRYARLLGKEGNIEIVLKSESPAVDIKKINAKADEIRTLRKEGKYQSVITVDLFWGRHLGLMDVVDISIDHHELNDGERDKEKDLLSIYPDSQRLVTLKKLGYQGKSNLMPACVLSFLLLDYTLRKKGEKAGLTKPEDGEVKLSNYLDAGIVGDWADASWEVDDAEIADIINTLIAAGKDGLKVVEEAKSLEDLKASYELYSHNIKRANEIVEKMFEDNKNEQDAIFIYLSEEVISIKDIIATLACKREIKDRDVKDRRVLIFTTKDARDDKPILKHSLRFDGDRTDWILASAGPAGNQASFIDTLQEKFQDRFDGGGHQGAISVRENVNDTDDFEARALEFSNIAREIISDIKKRKTSLASAQMGKGIEVTEIFDRDSKKIANVVNTATGKALGAIELTNKPDSQIFTKTLSDLMGGVHADYKPILEEFLELLKTSPPEFYTYSKLIKNLFGFARLQYHLIALHEALADNPLAIFHEICEYLAQLEAPDKSKVLKLTLKDSTLKDSTLTISINGKKFDVILSAESLTIANQDPANPHYLLRALQREIFGKRDIELTEKIQAEQIKGTGYLLDKIGKRLSKLDPIIILAVIEEEFRDGKISKDLYDIARSLVIKRDKEFIKLILENIPPPGHELNVSAAARAPPVIILINSNHGRDTRAIKPVGLARISSSLKIKGFRVEFIDASYENLTPQEVFERVKSISEEVDAKVIAGFSSLPNDSEWLKSTTELFNEDIKKDKILLVAGGYLPTMGYAEFLQDFPNIDFAIRGEGEIAIVELMEAIEDKRSIEDVHNLIYRNADGGVMVNPHLLLTSELLEREPFIDYSLLETSSANVFIKKAMIDTAHGCPGNCKFCGIHAFFEEKTAGNPGSKKQLIWRPRSAKRVVDEMEFLHYWYGIEGFDIVDDDFIGLNPERAEEIADEIMRRGLEIKFWFLTRAKAIIGNEKVFRKLKEAGLTQVYLGIESADSEQLRYYTKGITAEENSKAISIIRELGIDLKIGLINFYEFTTFEQLERNVAFIERRNLQTAVPGMMIKLLVYRKTRLYDELLERHVPLTKITDSIWDYPFRDPDIEKFYNATSGFSKKIHPLASHFRSLVDLGYFEPTNLTTEARKVYENIRYIEFYFFKEALRIFKNSIGQDTDTARLEILALAEQSENKAKEEVIAFNNWAAMNGYTECAFPFDSAASSKKPTFQIGNGIEVTHMSDEIEGKRIAKVTETATRQALGEIELTNKPDSQIFTKTLSDLMDDVNANYKPILEEFLELLKTSPPEFYTYSKLIKNLFGFARLQYHLIALHEALADNPLAIFHEIAEYLVQSKTLELKLEGNKLIISIKDRSPLTVTLNEEALAIAGKEKDSPHYLLRALQKEMFGSRDKELTEKIQAEQRTVQSITDASILERGAITLPEEAYLMIKAQINAIISNLRKGWEVMTTSPKPVEFRWVLSPAKASLYSIAFAPVALFSNRYNQSLHLAMPETLNTALQLSSTSDPIIFLLCGGLIVGLIVLSVLLFYFKKKISRIEVEIKNADRKYRGSAIVSTFGGEGASATPFASPQRWYRGKAADEHAERITNYIREKEKARNVIKILIISIVVGTILGFILLLVTGFKSVSALIPVPTPIPTLTPTFTPTLLLTPTLLPTLLRKPEDSEDDDGFELTAPNVSISSSI